ncbi:hypothetical protein DF185_22085 [Marinifilum breve]|uniref:Uncharacterized protein n=1 Tax=Marinifilum breve TaxID=2184082 RepID=A0A2V3ZRT2_9BACT|nr:hypothetical protein [Marinifilum breve]PXX95411.1 hypothetical protein DF185_22085 [Marinifilum breve]
MKKIELIAIIATIVALLLKQFELPYSGIILTISLNLLAIYYFLYYLSSNDPIAYRIRKVFIKEEVNNSITVKICGMGLPILLISILFKLMSYPYATTLFYIGLSACFLSCLLSFIEYHKTKDIFVRKMMARILIIGSIGLLLFFIPNEISNDNSDLQSNKNEIIK